MMITTLHYIEFIFSDSSSARVRADYIGDFFIDNIQKRINKAHGPRLLEFDDYAQTIAIEIHKSAEKIIIDEYYDITESLFKRLRENDVVSIRLEMESDDLPLSIHEYKVEWDVDNCNSRSNKYQHWYISELGHMYIVIDKEKCINDFFDFERINNIGSMNLHFFLHGVKVENE